MAECKECKSYFAIEETPEKGDCVRRVVDLRQKYYQAKPVNAGDDASTCASFALK